MAASGDEPPPPARALCLAFVVDPLPGLKAAKDSSIAMMRAAQARGHAVHAIDYATLHWRSPAAGEPGGVYGEAITLALRDGDGDWHRESGRAVTPLRDFDAVLMRKDPPFDGEYLAATWLLERAEAEGARVFNRPRALRDHSEKLAIAEFAQFAPATLVDRDSARLHAFIDAQGDVILKPLDGMGGSRIFRVRRDDPNRNVIVETLTVDGSRTIMAQRFLPGIAAGDKRILVVAGRVMPWALARIPKAGETRGNLAAGGRGIAQPLSARDREIAESLAPVLWQRGLLLVGLDVIGDHLTEINVTSPTCMVEIRAQTGFDIAAQCIAALEAQC
ncbi:MAG: glutathione synthase [Betaproteobacteria bacterium]|nr:glutathione synthase [Betaproteobacteria bacterium]